MTTTPTVWKAEITANAGNTTGSQHSPVTIGLADGRFLTAWVDNTNNVDNDVGNDIIGQIYDAQGNAFGNARWLNTFHGGDATNPAIAALPDGGFVVAYRHVDSNGYSSIHFGRYTGAALVVTVTVDSGNSTVANFDPSIAVLPNGDFVVSYRQTAAGDTDVIARIVDQDTNLSGAVLNAGQNGADLDTNPDTVVLSNGNILTAFEEDDDDLTGIEIKIITTAGTNIGNVELAATGSDPHAAALSGGGYVVVWQDQAGGGNIHAAIRTNTNGVVKGPFVVQGGANQQNEPDVVALKDGGFFVVWDDDSANLLRGQRFSAGGGLVGTTLTIAAGLNALDPELGLTDDGRILVTFRNDVFDISQVILDPRENVIIGDSTDETITSRIDGATVHGLKGNDTLLGQGAVDSLYSGDGNDVLNGGGSGDKMIGGAGSDTYIVSEVGDVANEIGGDGTDLVKSSVSFNLASANALGTVENLTLTGITAVNGIGNALDNTIVGNDTNNTLVGGDGDDTLVGGVGADTLNGNADADALKGGVGKDTLAGGQANDRFVFDSAPIAANADTITDFAQVVGSNNDFFMLDNLAFPTLGAPGAMNAALFFAGPAAHDANDRIIYNQANGQLLYDTNGNTAGGVSLIATLTNKPMLTAADFVVI
jgi:Ca2+-binding RTX toxin-like protein